MGISAFKFIFQLFLWDFIPAEDQILSVFHGFYLFSLWEFIWNKFFYQTFVWVRLVFFMHEFLFFMFFDNKGIKPFSFTRFSAMEGILGLSLILDDKFQFSARVSLQKDLKPILVLTQQFHNFAACTEPQIKLTMVCFRFFFPFL